MLTDPASYCIRVKGQMGPEWSDWFGGMTATFDEHDETTFSGQLLDQVSKPLTMFSDRVFIPAAILVIVLGLIRGIVFDPVQSLGFLFGNAFEVCQFRNGFRND